MLVRAGYSGDRLGNVMGILADLGMIDHESNALSTRGRQLLDMLGGTVASLPVRTSSQSMVSSRCTASASLTVCNWP
jgi:hypothetical protein